MINKFDSKVFILKKLKEKRDNATIFPIWKKNLLHEKKRIRALETNSPIQDIIECLRKDDLLDELTKEHPLPNIENVLNKANRDHYILGKITLQDKIEYYKLIDEILKRVKDYKLANKKALKEINN